MTTTIKVHVNGRYKALVKVNRENYPQEEVVVDGNYEGTSNPGGEKSFSLYHPAKATFEITEEYLGEAKTEA